MTKQNSWTMWSYVISKPSSKVWGDGKHHHHWRQKFHWMFGDYGAWTCCNIPWHCCYFTLANVHRKNFVECYKVFPLLHSCMCNDNCLLLLLNEIAGWKSFKVYHRGQKGPSLYYIPFLPFTLITIKNNKSKIIKYFKRTIF